MANHRNVVTDDYGMPPPHASVTVVEETRTARVTYRGEDGGRFRVNFVQRPNPIGFRAALLRSKQ